MKNHESPEKVMSYDLVGQQSIKDFLKLTTWRDVKTRIARGLPIIQEGGGPHGRWLGRAKDIESWIRGDIQGSPRVVKEEKAEIVEESQSIPLGEEFSTPHWAYD